jgi:hypothetical protein
MGESTPGGWQHCGNVAGAGPGRSSPQLPPGTGKKAPLQPLKHAGIIPAWVCSIQRKDGMQLPQTMESWQERTGNFRAFVGANRHNCRIITEKGAL